MQTIKVDNGWTVRVLPASDGRVFLSLTGPNDGDKGGLLVCADQAHTLTDAIGWARVEADRMVEAAQAAETAKAEAA